MTLFPTHISLEGLLLWSFIPRSEKTRFENNKKLFWLVLAFSILPDLDIFFGNHRGFSHSLILPSFLVIIGMILHLQNRYFRTNDKKNDLAFYGRIILYSGILWIIHVLIDLEYPLAIFYPLSDRLYQVNFFYLLDLLPWLFFPVMIVGIEFRVSSISYLKGLTTYFLNIPPSDRPGIFGSQVIGIQVEDILLHTFIFVIFFVRVAKPMLPKFSYEKIQGFKRRASYDGYILGAGLSLLLVGFIMGPFIGIQTVDSQSINSTLKISSTVFSPTVALSNEPTSYLLQPNTIASISGTLTLQTIQTELEYVLLISKQNDYTKFVSSISALYSSTPPNNTENVQIFEENYTTMLNTLYSTALAMNLSNQYEQTIKTQLSSTPFILLGILESWNSTLLLDGEEQSISAKLEIEVKTSRLTLFLIGSGTIISGILVVIISVRLKKYHSSQET